MKTHKNQTYKKLLPALLSASLVLTAFTPAFAAEAPSEKEEVIYVNLDSAGNIKDMYAVNIFGSGDITDYGDYSAVEILNTTDQISQNGDKITFSTDADRIYYKGTMKSKEIPWNIDIHYYMNGKEYSAKEIAGKSGALKMTISITQNAASSQNFFEGYALQATATLDTKQCKNIVAADATVANVGSCKQLSYTILPNKGADFTITADVTDFEMDGISINAIPLNLNVEVDDEELMEQVTELLDAIARLDDGASDLKDGTSDLKDGGNNLHDGVRDLKNGASDLGKGVNELSKGVTQMQTALNSLNKQSTTLTSGSSSFKKALVQLQAALGSITVTSGDLSDLRDASSAIKAGIEDLENGITVLEQNTGFAAYEALMKQNGLDIEQLRQQNTAAIDGLQATVTQLEQQISAMKSAGADTAALEAQIAQLQGITTLLGANNAGIQGTQNYLDTLHQNVSKLQKGASTLKDSYAAFDAKIGELVNALGDLSYQMGTLSSAVNTLVTEYEKLDDGISDYTGGVAQIVTAYTKITNGTKQLVTGSSSLKAGTNDLYSGTNDLLDGITRLSDGTGELKDGTSEMREETDGMDTEISDKIDDMLAEITGNDIEITSFVDGRNEHVKSVQFVIQTEGIQILEAEDTSNEEAAPLTFWQKLMKLFGFGETQG